MALIPGVTGEVDTVPRRSWRRRLAYWVLFLALVFAGVVGWAYWRGNEVIREAIAEVERTDPRWRLEQIEADRRQVPDAENSALIIAAGKKLIDNSLRDQKAESESWDIVGEIRNYPNARLNDEQKQCLAVLLKPLSPALAEWNKIDQMPHGRFPLKYSPDVIGTLLPGVQDARDCSNAFRYQLMACVEAGDIAGAVRAMKCSLYTGRAIGDEPFLISALVRIAIEAIAIGNLDWLLAQVQLDEPALAELQRILEEDAKYPLLTTAIRGERAGSFATIEYMKKNPSYISALGGAIAITGARWRIVDYVLTMLPGSLSGHQAECLKFLTKAVEISKLPPEQQAKGFADLDKEIANFGLLARLLVPSVTKVAVSTIRWQAQLRCAIVALAAERYRIKNGRWPETLSDLVAEKFLAEVPNDPFDGKPLRWKILPDGRLVYSVGKDGIDNDGHIDPLNVMNDGSDMGFRLFAPDHRRQAARPPKPKEPDPPLVPDPN